MKPNSTTWFKLFSLVLMPTQKVTGHATSNTKQQTLYGIAVRCNDQTNIKVYQIHSPAAAKILPYLNLMRVICPSYSILITSTLTVVSLLSLTDIKPTPLQNCFLLAHKTSYPAGCIYHQGTVSNAPILVLDVLPPNIPASADESPTPADSDFVYAILLDNGASQFFYPTFYDFGTRCIHWLTVFFPSKC